MPPVDSTTEQADDPVHELITSPIPKVLWHYTDLEGFRGIVNSRQIHATNIRYLNDKEEFEHGFKRAKDLLLEMLPPEEADPPMVRTLVAGTFERIFSAGALCPANLSLFTASFTLNGDQLSQWRGYSRGSAGVSLGFDFAGMRKFTAPKTPVTFAPCVYQDEDKARLLRHSMTSFVNPVLKLAMDTADIPTVRRALDELQKARPDLSPGQVSDVYFEGVENRRHKELPQTIAELSSRLLHLVALLKHSAFEEEEEWRLVLPVFAIMPNRPDLRFRSRSSTLVPYTEFPLTGGETVNAFRLKEVVLGPGSEDPLAVTSARSFLDSVGLKDVRISRSRIPYRPW